MIPASLMRILRKLSSVYSRFYIRTHIHKIKDKPGSIGIIIDGNRRYAAKVHVSTEEGYIQGKEVLQKFFQWCLDFEIPVIAVYVFSMENFNRSEEEVSFLMKQFSTSFKEYANIEKDRKKISIKAIGELNLLPEEVQESIRYAEESTREYSQLKLYIAIAYGGRAELVHAAKKIAEKSMKAKDVDENAINEALYAPEMPDIDLIIRTSELRLSNFLLWKSAYSELYFIKKFFPEIMKADLLKAILDYGRRGRRFGK